MHDVVRNTARAATPNIYFAEASPMATRAISCEAFSRGRASNFARIDSRRA